jgi:hypothetical protein
VGNLGVIGEPGIFLDSSALARLSTSAATTPQADAEKTSVTFVDKDGKETEIKVPVGTSMLEAVHKNDIELKGACEGSLAWFGERLGFDTFPSLGTRGLVCFASSLQALFCVCCVREGLQRTFVSVLLVFPRAVSCS